MFFIVILVVIPLGCIYLGLRLIGPTHLSRRSKTLAWTAIVCFYLLLYFGRYYWRHEPPNRLIEHLLTFNYIWLGFFGILFSGVFGRDVLLVFARLADHLRRFFRPQAPPAQPQTVPADPPMDPERRRFLVNTTNLGLMVLAGGLTGYGVYDVSRPPRVVRLRVPLKNLPKEFEGFRIAQISDLHVGPAVDREYVIKVIKVVQGLHADAIVLTGDIMDGPPHLIDRDVEPLSDLRALNGVLYVTGNHEYYQGVRGWLSEIPQIGFTPLMNEHTVITRGKGNLVLAGVPDPQSITYDPSQTPDIAKALAGAPENAAKVLLAHRPHAIFEASLHRFDLQLSGHTHGGQIFPGHLFVLLREPYISGLHRHDDVYIYVSRGAGYWGPPMRVGAPAEVTEITLTRA